MKRPYALISAFLIALFGLAGAQNGDWSEPINLGPPINSATQEYHPSITPGADMMVLRTGRGDSSGLFTSRCAEGQWSELDYVSSVGNPQSWVLPALSPDGSEIYFSCYGGGHGDYDIWKTVYDSGSGEWSIPENIGASVNNEGAQLAPFLSYDGQKLYFVNHSNRFDGLAVSERIGDDWSEPQWVNVYFAEAEDASLTYDESTLYFTKAVPHEHWAIFVSHKDGNGSWTQPERFDVVNDFGTPVYPRVNANGTRVYFCSEDMGGEGGADIWYVERPTGVDTLQRPTHLNLFTVYPNPSNSYFNIRIEDIQDSNRTLAVYDILGRELSRIKISEYENVVRWPVSGGHAQGLTSGIYIVRLVGEGGDARDTKKILLLK